MKRKTLARMSPSFHFPSSLSHTRTHSLAHVLSSSALFFSEQAHIQGAPLTPEDAKQNLAWKGWYAEHKVFLFLLFPRGVFSVVLILFCLAPRVFRSG
jgi:hypothetical protein